MARSASPPYPGFLAGGQYLCATYSSAASAVNLLVNPTGYLGAQDLLAFVPGTTTAVTLTAGSAIVPLFVPLQTDMQVAVWQYVSSGSPVEYRVLVDTGQGDGEGTEGTRTLTVNVPLVDPDRTRPIISTITLVGDSDPLSVTLEGIGYEHATHVVFTFRGRDIRTPRSQFIAPTGNSITVPVPENIILGLTDMTVVTRTGSSDPARLISPGGLGFATLEEELGVVLLSGDGDGFFKRIALSGQGVDVVATRDNTRAYVAKYEGTGRTLAVVDALTLEVAEELSLPSRVGRLVVDPSNNYLLCRRHGHIRLRRRHSPRVSEIPPGRPQDLTAA